MKIFASVLLTLLLSGGFSAAQSPATPAGKWTCLGLVSSPPDTIDVRILSAMHKVFEGQPWHLQSDGTAQITTREADNRLKVNAVRWAYDRASQKLTLSSTEEGQAGSQTFKVISLTHQRMELTAGGVRYLFQAN